MIAIILCVAAFLLCYFAGRRTLGKGLIALFLVGYLYGIVRANVLTTFSHFIFDAGLIGLYASVKWADRGREAAAGATLRVWTLLLLGWPLVVLLLPFQPILVSLVGLRGNIFFIPLLLIGSRLKHQDLMELSIGLAILNVLSFAFASAEYFTSVQRFYPFSPVTLIIYRSGDVEGGFLRIPAIFTSAHAYGGTMVATIPFLVGAWGHSVKRWTRTLFVGGIAASLIGVLMSATRQNFILGAGMVGFVFFTSRMRTGSRVVFVLLLALIGVVAATNPRFQRFKSLGDTEGVASRIAGSVNRSFLEILVEHPMGNGLGGGGSSIPYFLTGQVRNPIGMENEYARILCEQGIIGLLLWLAFLGWFVSKAPVAFGQSAWKSSRGMSWFLVAIGFATAGIGTGILTSIPQTVLLVLAMGWCVSLMPDDKSPRKPISAKSSTCYDSGLAYVG